MKKIKDVILYAGEGGTYKAQSQLDELTKYCGAYRMNPIAKYIDKEAGTGEATFNQILEDLNSGKINAEAILFTRWKIFSQSHETALKRMRLLRRMGITCVETYVPIFKGDNLVHHSHFIEVCGERFSSATTNLDYVTCKKCLKLLEKSQQHKK